MEKNKKAEKLEEYKLFTENLEKSGKIRVKFKKKKTLASYSTFTFLVINYSVEASR